MLADLSQRSDQPALARRILASDHCPTAIFAASDTQALGVVAAARELGLHVPDELSVEDLANDDAGYTDELLARLSG